MGWRWFSNTAQVEINEPYDIEFGLWRPLNDDSSSDSREFQRIHSRRVHYETVTHEEVEVKLEDSSNILVIEVPHD